MPDAIDPARGFVILATLVQLGAMISLHKGRAYTPDTSIADIEPDDQHLVEISVIVDGENIRRAAPTLLETVEQVSVALAERFVNRAEEWQALVSAGKVGSS